MSQKAWKSISQALLQEIFFLTYKASSIISHMQEAVEPHSFCLQQCCIFNLSLIRQSRLWKLNLFILFCLRIVTEAAIKQQSHLNFLSTCNFCWKPPPPPPLIHESVPSHGDCDFDLELSLYSLDATMHEGDECSWYSGISLRRHRLIPV